MLGDKVGLYALRLYDIEVKKDVKIIGPEMIDLNKQTKEFVVWFIIEEKDKFGNKIVEFYLRGNPDSIPYRK